MVATTRRASTMHPLDRTPLDSVDISSLLAERELRGSSARAITRSMHAHASFMPRLACNAVLEGHRGCVNHLRWNRNGSLLASGSDDHQVIVWDYATHKQREVIRTGHTGNIFAVCFVPETNDHIIASAAADCDVRLHYAPFRAADATKLFRVHRGRVKDIGTSWGMPQVFWSVAEDGVVFQFDVRALPPAVSPTASRQSFSPTTVASSGGASGAIVRLGRDERGRVLRGMGIATHPLDPTKFVLACGDHYTRLFDHRMLRLQSIGSSSSVRSPSTGTQPLEVFAPPHLHLRNDDQNTNTNTNSSSSAMRRYVAAAHGTSIQFSSDGARVLANYHSDHIYVFTVTGSSANRTVQQFARPVTTDDSMPGWWNGAYMDEIQRPVHLTPTDVDALLAIGRAALADQQYARALRALLRACSAAVRPSLPLSSQRQLFQCIAQTYVQRAWSCDAFLAAVYCKRALALDGSNDPEQTRALQLTFIQALHADKRTTQCRIAAQQYALTYRDHAADVDAFVHCNDSHSRNAAVTPPYASVSDISDASDDDEEAPHSDAYDTDSSFVGLRRQQQQRASASSNSNSNDDGDDDDDDDNNEAHHRSRRSSASSDASSNKYEQRPETPSASAAASSSSLLLDDDAFWTPRLLHGQRVNCDVVQRYVGYCNTETDIKEASFIGANDAFVVAGSDDGRAFVWNAATGDLVNAVVADASIVNCVRPHPFDMCLATSGIEDVIRLWTPTANEEQEGETAAPSVEDLDRFAAANQRKMLRDDWNVFFGSPSDAARDVVRVVFQSAGHEGGAPECATS